MKFKILKKVFSCTNEGKHKVLTVLGARLKIKSKINLLKQELRISNTDKKRYFIDKASNEIGTENYSNRFEYVLSVDIIKKLISNPEIKVVSFDIFDTLLYRPCINPTDLFYLIAKKVDKKFNIDFIKIRMHAENFLNNKYANLDDIYDFIGNKYKISKDILHELKLEEINCEKQLLTARTDLKEIYKYAISIGKRVIAISDMYLSSNILKDILDDKGYSQIAAIYVSNEFSARKDEGILYRKVFEMEDVEPSEICHIGDNFESDYKMALKKNILAIYYPSIKDIIFSLGSIYNLVLNREISSDPMLRILMGYSLGRVFSDREICSIGPKAFNNIKDFINLFLAPVLFFIVYNIATNKEIQTGYDNINFVARDGYLPKIAYDVLAKYMKVLPSRYVYASRRAYWSVMEDSLSDWIRNNFVAHPHLKFKTFLEGFISDEVVLNRLLKTIPDDILNLGVANNLDECLKYISSDNEILADYISNLKALTKAYYKSIFRENSEREVIFDIGYSGSVSVALSSIVDKKFDKIYLDVNPVKNKLFDEKYKTKTYLIFKESIVNLNRLHLILEELFSPLEGSCIGFDSELNVIKEKIEFSPEMKNIYDSIENDTRKYMEDICNFFGGYLDYLQIKDIKPLLTLANNAFTKSPYCESSLFKDIIYPDPLSVGNMTLESKVSFHTGETVFDLTGFDNPDNYVSNFVKPLQCNKSFGIHIHLYNLHYYHEFLKYLINFPFSFDLYITVVEKGYVGTVKKIFDSKIIKNLKSLDVRIVPNRGRDVAPWLIFTKDIQYKYDLFCHMHSKESKHFGDTGHLWRRYLLKNLLDFNAVNNICSVFDNPNIGVVFPKFYSKIAKGCIIGKISLDGVNGEIDMIREEAKKMGIKRTFCHNNLIFSAGTMMWYRPQALKILFDRNYVINDFPEEPIGVGGTLAHAIERLITFCCCESGYRFLVYTHYNE